MEVIQRGRWATVEKEALTRRMWVGGLSEEMETSGISQTAWEIRAGHYYETCFHNFTNP